jgi:hypothetical protein
MGFEILKTMPMKSLIFGILRRVVRWKSTDVSVEQDASIFKVEV